MTSEQFERWKDFALRMARTCFSTTMRAPSRKWIIEKVSAFLDRLDGDVPQIVDWDANHGEVYVCDEMSRFEQDFMPWHVAQIDEDDEEKYEDARERWWGPVRCCVRAGLDMASEPSAGVVGFTLGDLRRMYPEGLPAWVAGGFHKNGRPVSAKTIARAPDSMAVWL